MPQNQRNNRSVLNDSAFFVLLARHEQVKSGFIFVRNHSSFQPRPTQLQKVPDRSSGTANHSRQPHCHFWRKADREARPRDPDRLFGGSSIF
jgi:hypothetical protein